MWGHWGAPILHNNIQQSHTYVLLLEASTRTLGVEEGEASLESTEEPDFLLMMFLTEVERGGAGGGLSVGWVTTPPVTFPFREVEDWEVRLIEPACSM